MKSNIMIRSVQPYSRYICMFHMYRNDHTYTVAFAGNHIEDVAHCENGFDTFVQ